ncbi:MAG: hypothetical protein J0I60_03290 [Nitrosospira sp.]|jgi:hypothetical protein|nr:hypothetical protein [Nitrosospira sp.]
MKSGIVLACNMLCMLFISPLPPAMAANTCWNILTRGFHHEYSRARVPARDRAIYAELCASTFQMARNALAGIHQPGDGHSVAASLGLPGSGDDEEPPPGEELSQDRFHQWKSVYCSTTSYADASRAAEFFMQEAISDPASPILVAWRACMEDREGLACWATPSPSGSRDILLGVNWRKDGNSQPEVRHSFLSRNAVSNFKGAPARRLLPRGHKLDNGTLGIPLASLDGAGIVANLTVSQEEGEYSCNVFIPGERDFTLREPFVGH